MARLYTFACLQTSGIFLHQSGLDFVPQEGGRGRAAGSQEEKREAGGVDRQGTMALEEDLMAPLVVQKDGLQLGERADGKEGVEDLMSVAHNVTGAGEVLLGDRAGEEVGANKEEEDLEGVVPGRLLLATSQVTEGDAVCHGADV